MAAARDLRRRHGHQRRCDVAVPPAGHIAARHLTGDRLLSGDQAGHDLDLGVDDGRFLRLGETAHVVMGEANVVLEFLGNLGRGRRDLVRRQNDVALVVIKLGGVFQRRFVATRLDLAENGLHGRAHVAGIIG